MREVDAAIASVRTLALRVEHVDVVAGRRAASPSAPVRIDLVALALGDRAHRIEPRAALG
jgi:hypothetical protein